MHLRRIGLAVFCGIAALSLPGCATAPEANLVGVSLVGLRPLKASLFETSAEMTLRVTNESPQPLVLGGSSHKIYVNDTYIGKAVTNEPLTVQPLATNTQTVAAYLENLALVRKVQEMSTASTSTVSYRIESRLFRSGEQGGGTLRATATGQLDFGGFMPGQTDSPSDAR
jgi:LEA14-like dessication related protein